MQLSFLFGLLFFSLHFALGALPPDAQKVLDSLPEKKITVNLMVAKALQVSDSFETVKADAVKIEAPLYQMMGMLDPKVFAEIGALDDQSKDPNSSFGTNRIMGRSYRLGMSKMFPSGTAIEANIEHKFTDISFNSALIVVPPYYETIGNLSVRQSLWKNSFGSATRQMLAAGTHLAKSNEFAFEENIESWVLDLLDIYYGAWLAQAKAKVADEGLRRRTRLLKITNLKSKRGTAEAPDLLQVQSAHLGSAVQYDLAKELVWAEWRRLVTTLKFPEQWLAIDPMQIPIALDNPVEEALKYCSEFTPTASASTEKADHLAKAAKARFENATDSLRPDLDLSLNVSGNGINSDRGASLTETLQVANPTWQLGLRLSVPLGRDAQKAEAAEAMSNHMKAEAGANIAKDMLKVGWLNGCAQLSSLENSKKYLEKAWKNQLRRADLEDKRFRIGRSQTMNVIQAEDDASRAQDQLYDSEVNVRKAAWQIRRMAGKFKDYLKAIGVEPPLK